jgi:hypothetical protein
MVHERKANVEGVRTGVISVILEIELLDEFAVKFCVGASYSEVDVGITIDCAASFHAIAQEAREADKSRNGKDD